MSKHRLSQSPILSQDYPRTILHYTETSVIRKHAELTDLFWDLCNGITGQIEDQEVLEAGNKMRNLLQSSSVDLPLLDLTEVDETPWQRLNRKNIQVIAYFQPRSGWWGGLPSTLPVQFEELIVHLQSAVSASSEPE